MTTSMRQIHAPKNYPLARLSACAQPHRLRSRNGANRCLRNPCTTMNLATLALSECCPVKGRDQYRPAMTDGLGPSCVQWRQPRHRPNRSS